MLKRIEVENTAKTGPGRNDIGITTAHSLGHAALQASMIDPSSFQSFRCPEGQVESLQNNIELLKRGKQLKDLGSQLTEDRVQGYFVYLFEVILLVVNPQFLGSFLMHSPSWTSG
jgi:hypothetical protein